MNARSLRVALLSTKRGEWYRRRMVENAFGIISLSQLPRRQEDDAVTEMGTTGRPAI